MSKKLTKNSGTGGFAIAEAMIGMGLAATWVYMIATSTQYLTTMSKRADSKVRFNSVLSRLYSWTSSANTCKALLVTDDNNTGLAPAFTPYSPGNGRGKKPKTADTSLTRLYQPGGKTAVFLSANPSADPALFPTSRFGDILVTGITLTTDDLLNYPVPNSFNNTEAQAVAATLTIETQSYDVNGVLGTGISETAPIRLNIGIKNVGGGPKPKIITCAPFNPTMALFNSDMSNVTDSPLPTCGPGTKLTSSGTILHCFKWTTPGVNAGCTLSSPGFDAQTVTVQTAPGSGPRTINCP